ncbi:MAG: N-acetylornithine carbamoyltransferase [Planctomycetes bacterium]|nr:N-acetylornithine carbamoyltransferase [Planctomycetota bacterium]
MNLKGRHFITTQDFTAPELEFLLARAREFKHTKPSHKPLEGKAVALAFLNPSMRTRLSMELAVQRLGGTPMTLNVGGDSWSLEHRDGVEMNENRTEHVKDAVRVLGRYVSAIGVRAFARMENPEEDLADAVIMSFKKHSPVPVVNLESAMHHPCQSLADVMTLVEKRGGVRGLKVTITWAPHPKQLPTAVTNSFLLAATQFGCDVTLVHPEQFPLPGRALEAAGRNAAASGGHIRVMHSQPEAFLGAQVVYAKSWGSLAFYGEWEKEKEIRRNYTNWIVDERKMRDTNDALFMHCLPVRRNVEVADNVLDGRRNLAYDQAENRLWVQMAILEALIK